MGFLYLGHESVVSRKNMRFLRLNFKLVVCRKNMGFLCLGHESVVSRQNMRFLRLSFKSVVSRKILKVVFGLHLATLSNNHVHST